MDHVMHAPQEICEDSSNPIASDGVTGGNSSNLIKSETVIEIRSGESREDIGETSSDPVVSVETVIEVRFDEECECVDAQGMDSNAVENVVENPKEMVKELKIKVPLDDDDDDDDDDYSSGDSNGEDPLDGDKICRICHLSSDHGPGTTDLMELGCSCRGELGAVHRHCAETWFKLKGNRCCEICGETAKNITGVGDMRFMEEWNERRSMGNSSITSSRGRCWRGHRVCNFLMSASKGEYFGVLLVIVHPHVL
ncbi:hypothetical protein MRB53_019951 [Persea americana]|uniref:Uncharacterized protein n=1 Tax=Persea americana TaxID=3435 RepID=A0ACC2KZL1_PERAE|nr:hypothetical protein MRB53_019951 [Persea americana]